MLKKLPFFLFLFSIHSLLFAQQRTINFSAATGTYPGTSATQTIAQGSDSWVFSVSGAMQRVIRLSMTSDYLEVTTNGSGYYRRIKCVYKESR